MAILLDVEGFSKGLGCTQGAGAGAGGKAKVTRASW